LNVEAVMEGSVRYADDRVAVTVKLVDPSTNSSLWSESYNEQFSDIFAIQADIAKNIANALQAEFSTKEQARVDKEPTDSAEAYALYLRSMQAPENDRVTRIAFFDAAIAIDPSFALAYGRRALEYALLARFPAGPLLPADAERLAIENANKALELDANVAVAHAALGMIYEGRWQGAEAEAEYSRALQLMPKDTDVLLRYSGLKRALGDYEEAIRVSLRAVELDPQRFGAYHFLGHSYKHAGDLDAAAAAYETALELNPGAQGPLTAVAWMDIIRGDMDEAVRKLQQVEQTTLVANWQLPRVAYFYGLAGRSEEARRLFEQLQKRDMEGRITPITWAFGHFALGEYEAMLARLDEAVDDNSPGDFVLINELKANVFQDPVLEDDPRFVDVRSRLPFGPTSK